MEQSIQFNEDKYIVIYPDDFPLDIWQEYCDIFGLSYDVDYIAIFTKNVKYQETVNLDLNKAHYTHCEIEFIDDNTRQEVVIKSNDEYIEDEDDNIFFFGLHYNKIVEFCKNGDVIENEWKIIKVGDVSNEI